MFISNENVREMISFPAPITNVMFCASRAPPFLIHSSLFMCHGRYLADQSCVRGISGNFLLSKQLRGPAYQCPGHGGLPRTVPIKGDGEGRVGWFGHCHQIPEHPPRVEPCPGGFLGNRAGRSAATVILFTINQFATFSKFFRCGQISQTQLQIVD